jgi:hypothetical protein
MKRRTFLQILGLGAVAPKAIADIEPVTHETVLGDYIITEEAMVDGFGLAPVKAEGTTVAVDWAKGKDYSSIVVFKDDEDFKPDIIYNFAEGEWKKV